MLTPLINARVQELRQKGLQFRELLIQTPQGRGDLAGNGTEGIPHPRPDHADRQRQHSQHRRQGQNQRQRTAEFPVLPAAQKPFYSPHGDIQDKGNRAAGQKGRKHSQKPSHDGRAQKHGTRRRVHLSRDHRPRAHDAVIADFRAVQHRGAHANQHVVSDSTAVYNRPVSNRAARANMGFLVEHSAVLNVGALAHCNSPVVAPQNGVVPDVNALGQSYVPADPRALANQHVLIRFPQFVCHTVLPFCLYPLFSGGLV